MDRDGDVADMLLGVTALVAVLADSNHKRRREESIQEERKRRKLMSSTGFGRKGKPFKDPGPPGAEYEAPFLLRQMLGEDWERNPRLVRLKDWTLKGSKKRGYYSMIRKLALPIIALQHERLVSSLYALTTAALASGRFRQCFRVRPALFLRLYNGIKDHHLVAKKRCGT